MSDKPSLAAIATDLGPTIIAVDVGRYAVAASLMFAVVLLVRATSWRRRKIQPRAALLRDYRREILASLRTGLVFGLIGIGVAWGIANGVLQLTERGGVLTIPLTLVALLVAHDAYFYWTHRAMHLPRLYRIFHRTHHRSVTPTPFAAYSFDVPEAVVQAVFVPLWLLVVPTHPVALFLFLGIMILRNSWGHCGYELHPRGMADHPIWGQLTTTTHHDLHHSGGFDHNFALYFTWWDRWMGTEHPDYRLVYREVTAAPVDAPVRALPARLGLLLGAALVIFAGGAAVAAEVPPVGDWATQGYAARVRIESCPSSPEQLCGRITWLWESVDARGRPMTDSNNPDPALRRRPLVGVAILDGFRRASQGGWRGRIYNPEDGRSYAANLSLRDDNLLAVEGCALLFCRTQLWRRVAASGAPI